MVNIKVSVKIAAYKVVVHFPGSTRLFTHNSLFDKHIADKPKVSWQYFRLSTGIILLGNPYFAIKTSSRPIIGLRTLVLTLRNHVGNHSNTTYHLRKCVDILPASGENEELNSENVVLNCIPGLCRD